MLDEARVLVVGDSGVGKTALVHLLCHQTPQHQPAWHHTVGCSVDVKLHAKASEARGSDQKVNHSFIEFWDIGGAAKYEKSRTMFYGTVNGVMLIHDVTNRKSYKNLWRWLNEVLAAERGRRDAHMQGEAEFELRIDDDFTHMPLLLVGTKADLIGPSKAQTITPERYSLAHELSCGSVVLSTQSLQSFEACEPQFNKFYDTVLDRSTLVRKSTMNSKLSISTDAEILTNGVSAPGFIATAKSSFISAFGLDEMKSFSTPVTPSRLSLSQPSSPLSAVSQTQPQSRSLFASRHRVPTFQ